ncbi:MAG: Ig-like domain-containing protein [Treponema sp.]
MQHLKKVIQFFIFISIGLVFAGAAFARGKRDVEEKSAENPKSWQETFDLSAKKKGKYNIMVTATDLSGNKTVEGPYNIYVAPKSDLPVCAITNPQADMRVSGNLNIVGTCMDDDSVQYVELVLDGDEANPVRASGTEFWSYFLDTRDLEEGAHTIQVVGYDVNGLASEPVFLSWNLDRRTPLTAVENYGMGALVSGKIAFKGEAADGNGIKSLEYSLDNGETFKPVKLSGKKGTSNFRLSLDTKNFADGPAVIWFKAHDNTGSAGIYSFLYFVDNTKPDVKIVQPEEKVAQNGKFLVAGTAKDVVGLEKLTWKFGKQTGEFELIPGNPYWGVIVDTVGAKEKSGAFEITALDRAGNAVTVSRVIPLNQEADKPTLAISDPNGDTVVGAEDTLFVRGIAHDDDGVASVKYRLDGGDWIEEETPGAFSGILASGAEISSGAHKVTVVAKDVNGVESNPHSVSFNALGAPPSFTDIKIGNEPFTDGMSVHPEAGLKFQAAVSSASGLSSVHYDILWGADGVISKDIPASKTSANIVIPIGADFPKGVVTIRMTASDSAGRKKTFTAAIDVTNTAVLPYTEPNIVFDGSAVDENGVIINDAEFPATGYFSGGTASRVELVPETPFAKAELRGNGIRLAAGAAAGTSEPVVVRVTTDQGLSYDSQKIIFKNGGASPIVTIADSGILLDGAGGALTINGAVASAAGIEKLAWRVFSAKAVRVNGSLASFESVVQSEWNELPSSSPFSIPFNAADYGEGLHIVEVMAESRGGKKSAAAVCVKNIAQGEDAPPSALKSPAFVWADGENVYYAAYFDEDANAFGSFERTAMNAGNNVLTAALSGAGGKNYSSKYTALKAAEIRAHIASINGSPYVSGMPVELAAGASSSLQVVIDTDAQPVSVAYEITGDAVPGGAAKQSGSVKAVKQADGARWTAEIPLANLPARMNAVKLTVKAASASAVVQGAFGSVRPADPQNTDDERAVYAIGGEDAQFDKAKAFCVIKPNTKFVFYANTPEVKSAEFTGAADGFHLETAGNAVFVTAEKAGTFKDVAVRVNDGNGASYVSKPLTFTVDSGAPVVRIIEPEAHSWVKNTLKIGGTASDSSGIASAEYSLDGGQNWTPLTLSAGRGTESASFSAEADISGAEEGLVTVDVRAFDAAGFAGYAHAAAHKDTTPPQVQVVLPEAGAAVNGVNLAAFIVKDDGKIDKAYYVPPKAGKDGRVALDTAAALITRVGTTEQPLASAMAFEFSDAAGNVSEVTAWDFTIDDKADLPVVEIHLPAKNAVITRDFTVSGVVYDDDGESSIYYRIDGGEYKVLPEAGASFAIDIPFAQMTDNEHTVSVYAVDINGVKGEAAERKFRVSTEEPKGAVLKPEIDTSVKRTITVSGTASDKNGIERVQVSVDNGNSYNDAEGTEEWSYTFDTRTIPNGTQAVFVKVIDKYGIEGLYSSLINIDNQQPELTLDLPLDYANTAGPLFFSGYAFDNAGITDLFVTVQSLDQKAVPKSMQRIRFGLERIIAEHVDLSGLENGEYNIALTALDKAGNETHLSRNIVLDKAKPLASVEILYPLNGEHKQGNFNIYGQASADKPIETLSLYIDDKHAGEATLTAGGYFAFGLSAETIAAGTHTCRVDARIEGGTVIRSREQTFSYTPVGAWITIDNFDFGGFAFERPYIRGSAGYSLDAEEEALLQSKETPKEKKREISRKKVSKVEVSFDNGRTFKRVSRSGKWKRRIENLDMPEGYHFMLVKATMQNGETCIERTIIRIDGTKPEIRLISPGSGGRYNQELAFSGLASDNVELEDVKLTLRKGDKASYQLPSFIQGLYLDVNFWGATLFDIGMGLTFFDDNVKVQVQWGQFTQKQRDVFSLTNLRYGGDNVIGLKILANVGRIPFSSFLGRDWDWLSANFAIGANFTRFNETNSGKPQILSALLGQIEFPKATFPKFKMFSSFSLYTEFSLWFIPTDVGDNASIKNLIPQISEGIRVNVF